MKRAVKVALILVGLLVPVFLLWPNIFRHGHVDELLEVTVRIVDRDTGEAVVGAVVATVRFRSQLAWDDFEWYLKEAMRASESDDAWESNPIACATKTTKSSVTTVRSVAFVTRYWFASVETDKEVGIPEVLLIDHPRHGRTIIPISQEAPVEEGAAPDTWRLDLGVIRVPR